MDKNPKNLNKRGKQKMKKQQKPNIVAAAPVVTPEVPKPVSIVKKEFKKK